MKNQFMPIFWGDFLANTLHLSAQEAGAYLFLIAHAWEHGGVVLYKDARRIARVAPKYWPSVWAQLEPLFEVERGSKDMPYRLLHRRVFEELAIAAKLKSKRSAAGMAGAIKRWGKPMANAMPKTWQTQWPGHSKLPKKDNPSSFPLPREESEEQEVGDKQPQEMTLTEINKRWRGQ